MGRDLTALERGILEFVLDDPDLPDGVTLRAQVPYTHVVDGEPRMPTYVHVAVTSPAAAADCPDGCLPVRAVVESPSGEVTGLILVWTAAGYLSTIEHAWLTDEMPDAFPSPSRLRRYPRADGSPVTPPA